MIACGEAIIGAARYSTEHGRVTCFRCRASVRFKAEQLDRGPVPLGQVIAEDPALQVLHRAGLAHIVKRGLNSGTNDGEHEALTELADALGLVYDDDSESYR